MSVIDAVGYTLLASLTVMLILGYFYANRITESGKLTLYYCLTIIILFLALYGLNAYYILSGGE